MKLLPVQKCYFWYHPQLQGTSLLGLCFLRCPQNKLFHQVSPRLKLFSPASCFCLLPSGSVRETKLSWTPEISLFTWGEELAFYTLPLCERGKAPLLHNHRTDQLTGNSSHFQRSTCTIFCPCNEPHRLFLTSLLKSAQRLLRELHRFILYYIWLYRWFCPFRCSKRRCPKLVCWRDDW